MEKAFIFCFQLVSKPSGCHTNVKKAYLSGDLVLRRCQFEQSHDAMEQSHDALQWKIPCYRKVYNKHQHHDRYSTAALVSCAKKEVPYHTTKFKPFPKSNLHRIGLMSCLLFLSLWYTSYLDITSLGKM